jgi:hypothetical protein
MHAVVGIVCARGAVSAPHWLYLKLLALTWQRACGFGSRLLVQRRLSAGKCSRGSLLFVFAAFLFRSVVSTVLAIAIRSQDSAGICPAMRCVMLQRVHPPHELERLHNRVPAHGCSHIVTGRAARGAARHNVQSHTQAHGVQQAGHNSLTATSTASKPSVRCSCCFAASTSRSLPNPMPSVI